MGMLEDLIAQLDALDGRTVTVTQMTTDAAALARDVAREFNKAGGPKIRARAIDNR